MRIIILLAVVVMVTACGSVSTKQPMQPTAGSSAIPSALPVAENSAASVQTSEPNVPSTTLPIVTDQQVSELVDGNTNFAMMLYRSAARSSDTNICFSPYSVSLAFSMLYQGARGDTATQLAQVFHFLPQDVQHQAFSELDQQLNTQDAPVPYAQGTGTPFHMTTASAMWGQQNVSFKDTYLKDLAQLYGTGLHSVDFAQQPQQASDAINAWAAEQTQNRIKTLVSPNAISPATQFILTNAVYFNASWAIPFSPTNTQEEPFTLPDQRQVVVPFMRYAGTRLLYTENEDYQATALPYVGETVDMLLVLPQEGRFDTVEQQLSNEFFTHLSTQMQEYDVTLAMPRFAFESDLELPTVLQEIGLLHPFSATADFSAITNETELYLSDAVHRSTITVDENGTEASAATALLGAVSEAESAQINLNRPFIFAIVDRPTGTILFLGRVTDPSQ